MLADLDPIALDELLERAALLARVDRKYVLPTEDLPALIGGLPGGLRVLSIDDRRSFRYRSVYFDTPELTSFMAAAHRRRRRFKIRIRSYVDSDLHFTEVKLRGARGHTVKERAQADRSGQLDSSGQSHASKVLHDAGLGVDPLTLDPVLHTHYRRTTLFVPATASRVTIDTDLRWVLPGGRSLHLDDRVIVETKTARATSEVDRLLWSLKHRPCVISKYATGLVALRPDLPANRWRPVLRRHFPIDTQES